MRYRPQPITSSLTMETFTRAKLICLLWASHHGLFEASLIEQLIRKPITNYYPLPFSYSLSHLLLAAALCHLVISTFHFCLSWASLYQVAPLKILCHFCKPPYCHIVTGYPTVGLLVLMVQNLSNLSLELGYHQKLKLSLPLPTLTILSYNVYIFRNINVDNVF